VIVYQCTRTSLLPRFWVILWNTNWKERWNIGVKDWSPPHTYLQREAHRFIGELKTKENIDFYLDMVGDWKRQKKLYTTDCHRAWLPFRVSHINSAGISLRMDGKMSKTRIWGEAEGVRLNLRMGEICASIYSRFQHFYSSTFVLF